MKSCVVFIAIFFCLIAACSAACGPASPGAYAGAPASASIPAPPCPKNYLFSCQPQLRPIPCGQAAAGVYGGAGSYSDQYPIYALPPYNAKYPTEQEDD